jgi:hypothetical protein
LLALFNSLVQALTQPDHPPAQGRTA